jgi:carbon storage regulator
MLVLSRKIKQQILIGDNIVVTVLRLKGDAVQIGIEAPKNVRLLRQEIAHRSADPNAEAVSASSDAADRHDVSPPTIRHAMVRSSHSARAEAFSPPSLTDREPLGESSGLFPYLRDRAMRAPHGVSG